MFLPAFFYSANVGGFLLYINQKKYKEDDMNKIEYIANGDTKNFIFTFPFFSKSDIVVRRNGQPIQNGFSINTVENSENADIPYAGGTVVFNTAPAKSEIITIFRNIVPNRVVDYQPTAKITPESLNQDFNFTMEVLKDFRGFLAEFEKKYAQVIDVPALEKMMQAIDTFSDRQEIDIALQNKMSVNADNCSNTGKANIASMPMPGTKYINLTTNMSSQTICSGTAPTNGYVYIRINQGASGKYLLIKNVTNGMETTLDTARGSGYCAIYMPIPKGHQYQIQTNCTGTVDICRFFYAQGEQ